MGVHSLLIRVCAKKKKKKIAHCSFYYFSIGHVYRRVGLLHSVYVSERVRMRASFWDSILVYILGESMSHPFDFCESCEWSFFRISRSFPYSSLYPFLCDLSPCFNVGWPSLTFLSLCFLLFLFYYSILLHFIWFLSFLILLDIWPGFSIHTLFLLIQYVHSLIITFCERILRSMNHDVF